MTPEERLAAKQTNESLKLSATLANNLAVGLFVGGVVAPNASGKPVAGLWYAALTLCAVALHMSGKALLRLLKRED